MRDHFARGVSRRHFLQGSAAALAGSALCHAQDAPGRIALPAEPPPGARPFQTDKVEVLNPRGHVPVSFIIDDSTTLANLAHFCIPQFAEVFPDRYRQDWRKLPREIPDDFVREFRDWCGEQGVKGKYSIVPYPALVGWVDRELPGWSRHELQQSLALVRDTMTPDWDIHPEMVTHTWAINTNTGRPYSERTQNQMENWGYSVGLSTDEMANYLAYALKILKRAGLHCDGLTTPGGFGSRSRFALSRGTLQACQDVYQTEIPHYFRHLYTDATSVAPRVEFAMGLETSRPECVVSIIGCTGDWFGGWDGLTPGSTDKFITADLQSGRMVDVIDRGEPAIMVCHWPGIYYNGEKIGYRIFQQVVELLHEKYDHLAWMKLSEIARYWAARELTEIHADEQGISFSAPYACPQFTLGCQFTLSTAPKLMGPDRNEQTLERVNGTSELRAGTFLQKDNGRVVVCIDLPRGRSMLAITG